MSRIIAEENTQHYVTTIIKYKQGRHLEKLEEQEIKRVFTQLTANSIAYQIFSRCHLDTQYNFTEEDFNDITLFNTLDTIGQLGSTVHDLTEIGLDDIAKLLNIVTRDIIEKDREKSKAVISITMVNAASECAKFVASTIITNNVDNNRDQIEYNARHLVNSVYYDAYSKLNMYRGDEDYLSHYMKEEWKEDIYGDIINIIYNKNIDSNQRILAFNKRIDIRVNDYTAYIINRAFK